MCHVLISHIRLLNAVRLFQHFFRRRQDSLRGFWLDRILPLNWRYLLPLATYAALLLPPSQLPLAVSTPLFLSIESSPKADRTGSPGLNVKNGHGRFHGFKIFSAKLP